MERTMKGGKCMKRIVQIIIFISVLAGCLCVCAQAEFAVVSNTSSLNLRSGPGYEYGIIGTASRNEWVNIHSDLDGWDYVTVLKSGKSGYMLNSFLKRENSGDTNIGIVKNKTASGFLNLREYPSYSAKVLGIYYNGSTCKVLNHLSGWYMVEIDSKVGYFREEFLIVSSGSTAMVTAANGKPVNMRSGPSMNYPVLGSIAPMTDVLVLLKGNGFWQISYNGQTGFMSSVYLKENGDDGIRPVITNGYLIVNSTNGGKVNLRAQPSTSAKVLMKYDNGTRLEVIEGGLTWCKVYGKSSGLTGYIMTRFTTVYGLPGTPTKTVSNGKSYVNLRNSPSATNGKVLSRVNSGEKVIILIPGDEWIQVRYGNIDGYMMTHFLK